MLKRVINRVKNAIRFPKSSLTLDGQGERVDIFYKRNMNIEAFDMYQKSHYFRYNFARQFINKGDVCGDFACGTGYGSMMLAEKAAKVIGMDLNSDVISAIKNRYKSAKNVEFYQGDLLGLNYVSTFDKIISFETIEHFEERDIELLFKIFKKALKPGGQLLFSTPYMQEQSEAAIKMGFHFVFYIDEAKVTKWLTNAGFKVDYFKYQNYQTHVIEDQQEHKDFIICKASI